MGCGWSTAAADGGGPGRDRDGTEGGRRVAAHLGRAVSVVSREVRRGSAGSGYQVVRAERLARQRRSPPMPRLAHPPEKPTNSSSLPPHLDTTHSAGRE